MEWIYQEITQGIRRLYSLRLANHPAADQIQRTIETWCESIGRQLGSKPNQEIDTIRIREGFAKLIDDCDRWPSPSMLHKAMPDRNLNRFLPQSEKQEIDSMTDEERREQGRKAMAKVRSILDGKVINKGVHVNEKARFVHDQ